MFKVVWRFNLEEGIKEEDFFKWLSEHVWSSSAKYGCVTTAYKIRSSKHSYSTEAVWQSEEHRNQWASSDDFKQIPNYPGFDSPWGAQKEMESVVYSSLLIE